MAHIELLAFLIVSTGLSQFKVESVAMLSKNGFCTIAGYFAVHSPTVRDGAARCGTINIQDGIFFLEAFRYAINVSNKIGLLPKNFTIGYQLYDTCKSTLVLKQKLLPTIFTEEKKLLGVVGPYTSSAAVLSASVFSVFSTTAISYKASSLELEDRGRYGNFFRTVASDRFEAEAIFDILVKFEWTYVSCVSSHEKQQGVLILKSLIENKGKCIAKQVLLPEIPENTFYDDAIDSISSDSKAKVIILFTTREDTVELLRSAKKKGYGTDILWIGGTGWGNLMLKSELGPVGHGSISLNYISHEHDEKFRDHFKSLNPVNNNYPLFKKFWETVFDCSFSSTDGSKKPCTGREKLTEGKGFPQLSSVGPVIDAVFIYAQALKISLQKTCEEKADEKCFKAHYSGNILNWIRANLVEESFKSLSDNSNVSFDAVGGVKGRFSVLNLAWKRGSYEYSTVGNWQRDASVSLLIDKQITWPNGSSTPINSRCSEPCNRGDGQVKLPSLSIKGKNCCWECKLCKPEDIISINDTCMPCENGYKPDKARRRCMKLAQDYVSFTHPVGIIAIILSVVGILLTTLIMGLFICHSKMPVVKASSRELSFVMLIGIYICFTAAIVFLSPPTKLTCGIQRFIAGLSLNLCYASLLLKTNRLYRIFKNATLSVTKPSLTSPFSQVVISLGITSIQVLLGVVWSIGAPPNVHRHFPSNKDYVMMYCNTDAYIMNVNLCVCLVLMLACTWFAFKTRNFPKNFNESKSTMLTMYASCFVWGVFLPIFILSDNEKDYARTYTIVLFCDIIAYVTLAGLFAPKVRLILWPGKVVDESSGGIASRAEVRALKINTLMSRAIISSYPAVTMQYAEAVDEASQNQVNDGNNQSTSKTDLHL